jgi:hypothetical protein
MTNGVGRWAAEHVLAGVLGRRPNEGELDAFIVDRASAMPPAASSTPALLTDVQIAAALNVKPDDVEAMVAAGCPFLVMPSGRRFELAQVRAFLVDAAERRTIGRLAPAKASAKPPPPPAKAAPTKAEDAPVAAAKKAPAASAAPAPAVRPATPPQQSPARKEPTVSTPKIETSAAPMRAHTVINASRTVQTFGVAKSKGDAMREKFTARQIAFTQMEHARRGLEICAQSARTAVEHFKAAGDEQTLAASMAKAHAEVAIQAHMLAANRPTPENVRAADAATEQAMASSRAREEKSAAMQRAFDGARAAKDARDRAANELERARAEYARH